MALEIVESRASSASKRKILEESKDEQENYGQLLPGIPNEISLDCIAAKLLWKDICTLSSVSRGWYHAVRSREVHRAKVRLQSTENFFFQAVIREGIGVLYLRSKRDNSGYQLPPILGPGGFPFGSSVVPLDGKVFVLGGQGKSDSAYFCNEVYVFDFAGQKQWKPCARMKQARGNFGSSVLDGKIYVFGGVQYRGKPEDRRTFHPVIGSEVYDPEENSWKTIKASPKLRCRHQAVPVGRELVLCGGDHISCLPERARLRVRYITFKALSFEAYNPDKDDWRVPSESSDSWARRSTTSADLMEMREVRVNGITIVTRQPRLSV